MPLARIFLPAVRPAHLPQAPLAPLVVALEACILAVLLCRNGFDIIPSKTPPHKLALLSLVSRIGWSGLPVRPTTKLGEGPRALLVCLGGLPGNQPLFQAEKHPANRSAKTENWPNDQMGDAGAASRWKGARRHQPEFGSGGQRRTSSMGPPYCWGLSSAEQTSGQVTGGACSKRISAVSLAWSSASSPRPACQAPARTSAS